MYKTLHASDALVLIRLFAAEHHQVVVYDPARTLHQDAHLFYPIFSDLDSFFQWLDLETTNDSIFLLNAAKESLATLFTHPKIDCLLQKEAIPNTPYRQQLAFINNPDSSIRWIFPKTNRHALHLDLYNASGWKAKLYRSLSQLCFRLGAASVLYSGTFYLQSKSEVVFFQNLQDLDYEGFAIFTGTVSTTRKAIVALSRQGETNYFVKLPIAVGARQLLNNEQKSLKAVAKLSLKKMSVPQVHTLLCGIAQENSQPIDAWNSTYWQRKHAKALDELYEHSNRRVRMEEIAVMEKIELELEQLIADLNSMPPSSLSKKMNLLMISQLRVWRKLPKSQYLPVAQSHGDFTPWNMYLSKEGLYLYDWELAQSEMPLLFDAFHFIFQTGILIHRHSWDKIKKQIQALEKSEMVQKWIAEFQLDFNLHLQFYLLYITANYLPQYLHQQPLHSQAYWLMKVWGVALKEQEKAIPKSEPPDIPKALTSIKSTTSTL